MSDSLQHHELQQARLSCPSLSSWVCANSCQWCHPTISPSVAPFFSCPQSFPASGSFSVSWLSTSGGQSCRGSASAPVLPMNIQGLFALGLTGLFSLLSKGFFKSLLQRHSSKALVLRNSASLWSSFMVTSIRDYWNNHSFDYGPLLAKWYLCFLIHYVCHSFSPRSECLLISWLQSPSTVILEPKKMRSDTVSPFSPSICHEVIGPDVVILVFWLLEFQPGFFTLLFHPHQEAL